MKIHKEWIGFFLSIWKASPDPFFPQRSVAFHPKCSSWVVKIRSAYFPPRHRDPNTGSVHDPTNEAWAHDQAVSISKARQASLDLMAGLAAFDVGVVSVGDILRSGTELDAHGAVTWRRVCIKVKFLWLQAGAILVIFFSEFAVCLIFFSHFTENLPQAYFHRDTPCIEVEKSCSFFMSVLAWFRSEGSAQCWSLPKALHKVFVFFPATIELCSARSCFFLLIYQPEIVSFFLASKIFGFTKKPATLGLASGVSRRCCQFTTPFDAGGVPFGAIIITLFFPLSNLFLRDGSKGWLWCGPSECYSTISFCFRVLFSVSRDIRGGGGGLLGPIATSSRSLRCKPSLTRPMPLTYPATAIFLFVKDFPVLQWSGRRGRGL